MCLSLPVLVVAKFGIGSDFETLVPVKGWQIQQYSHVFSKCGPQQCSFMQESR